ncbi:2-polyprenyl-6-methoxyphenol hydroxylase-like FAD-dependent oxidoreductase [Streptomyces sp. Ag109_G2-6]|uniref:FAD-dependent monooxygenase n=1 Tax=Streptomyces TaxID=1883 RepID=UPI0009A4D17C|nr:MULTISPECIES: FAD-dependent monooxygenase [Streptomyces]RPF43842.1 2-polyprenyl-6-methoxyphenol hydroxylase-like FAD-dependent oxidoreductase [Streptomyces sp. Ag109_G2-6]
MNTQVTGVIVVGAGGAGLMLATELALAGVPAVVLDRMPGRNLQSRAGAIQPRTAEVLALRGLLDGALGRSVDYRLVGGHFAGLPVPLDYAAWDTRYPHPVLLPQDQLEAVLEDRLAELGGRVLREHLLTGLRQDADGVVITMATPAGDRSLRGRFLVACDGAHSSVRKTLGAAFPGRAATVRMATADLLLTGEVDDSTAGHISSRIHTSPEGHFAMITPLANGLHKLLFSGPRTALAERDAPVTAEEVREVLRATHGGRLDVAEIRYASRFSDASRQLEQYRHGRVFFAGDSAHIHSPAGGQGLNLGVQDAFNLGWKLAAVLRGEAEEELLDTYQTERHPVAARVLALTRAQGVVMGPQRDGGLGELRDVLTDLLRVPEANRYMAGVMAGLDLRLPSPDAAEHPLLGLRMPDLDLVTGEGEQVRFSDLTRGGRGVLLDLADTPLDAADPWKDRIVRVRARAEEGAVDAGAVLVRPDGYVCWAGGAGLTETLTRWFGPAGPGGAAGESA